jgi:hypothetical protein
MARLPGTCLRSAFVIYQDPLAYLLGLEGIALLDAWAGDHDRASPTPGWPRSGG